MEVESPFIGSIDSDIFFRRAAGNQDGSEQRYH